MIKQLPLKIVHLYFLLSVISFLIVELAKSYQVASGFVTGYVNDILVIPIVSVICLHVLWFIKRNKSLRLDALSIASLVLLYSIYFEWYLPQVNERYTGDVWDLVCYATGGFIFYLLQRFP